MITYQLDNNGFFSIIHIVKACNIPEKEALEFLL